MSAKSRTEYLVEILKNAIKHFSPHLKEAGVLTADGLIVAGASNDPYYRAYILAEEDRLSSMSMAGLSLGERITQELANGEAQETIVEGSVGTFFVMGLNEEYILATHFTSIESLDEIRIELHNLSKELIQILDNF